MHSNEIKRLIKLHKDLHGELQVLEHYICEDYLRQYPATNKIVLKQEVKRLIKESEDE